MGTVSSMNESCRFIDHRHRTASGRRQSISRLVQITHVRHELIWSNDLIRSCNGESYESVRVNYHILTDDDLPRFLVLGHFIGHTHLRISHSSNDEDDETRTRSEEYSLQFLFTLVS